MVVPWDSDAIVKPAADSAAPAAAPWKSDPIVKAAPSFVEAHVTLATVYYRLKRKEDGDRERAIVQKLNAEAQAKQPGVNVK